ncbi:hypothetical protein [Glutamicibacter nicotianae]|uniref:hypothetical protein n=1 Tax=Glutamicibacter nicotianae TaxID=37929 RepID=UPI0013CF23FC|nr:hypothetical protein [Glutamicibacter nicotianae]
MASLRGKLSTLKEMEYDNYSAWKRHRPWIFRVASALLFVCASWLLLLYAFSLTNTIDNTALAGMAFGSIILFGVGLFFLMTSFGKMRLAWRAFRRSKGHYTKSEMVIVNERAELARAQIAAAQLAGDLYDGTWRPQDPPWDVVTESNELVICAANANYARFYGSDVTYMQSSGFLMGHPTFVAVGVLAMAWGNRTRRTQAEALAKEQWREQQEVLAVITNHRVICRRQDGVWLSFYFHGASSMDIDSSTGTMIMQFPDTQPLILGGTGGLYAAVAAVWAVRGARGLEGHPGLAYLRSLEEAPRA